MEIVFWTIAAVLALQLLFVLWNLRQLPQLGGTGEGRLWLAGGEGAVADLLPRLSVLIPARNEAERIGVCVQAVLAAEQSPLLEVLVLDDQSADGTADVAMLAAQGDRRLRVLRGADLPDGWLGKSHACQQLAQEARGEWLLFLDADATLRPGALPAAMDTALRQGKGLISGFPHQQTGSWLERLVVPLMNFTIACHLPIGLVRGSADAKFVAAHGAFLLIHAESYAAIGGHHSFKSKLLDDMEMARAVKRAGLPMTLADVSGQVSMRMYTDAAGVWNGYKKNIFAGTGRQTGLLAALGILYALIYLLPPAMFIAALLAYAVFSAGTLASTLATCLLPAAIGWLLAVIIKGVIDHRGRLPVWFAFLLPAGIVMLIGIAAASWRAAASGEGYLWKGRRYL